MGGKGDGAHRVLSDGQGVWGATWSPDGSTIAFLSYYDGRANIAAPELYEGAVRDAPLVDIRVLVVDTGKVTDPHVTVATNGNPVSWLPSGDAFLVNRYD